MFETFKRFKKFHFQANFHHFRPILLIFEPNDLDEPEFRLKLAIFEAKELNWRHELEAKADLGAFLYGQTRVVIFSSQTKGPLCLKIVFKKAAAEESTATIKK